MGVIKMLECDNCETETFKKDEPHFRVRAVNKAEGKVHKLILCVKCARELFESEPDADATTEDAPTTDAAPVNDAPAPADPPAPAKTAPAPAKTAQGNRQTAKAS